MKERRSDKMTAAQPAVGSEHAAAFRKEFGILMENSLKAEF